MSRDDWKYLRVPVPGWFGAYCVLPANELVVEAQDTHFDLHNQLLLVGRRGLVLLGPSFLREGSQVLLRLTSGVRRLQVRASVRAGLPGLGTILRFLPLDEGARHQLEMLLSQQISA